VETKGGSLIVFSDPAKATLLGILLALSLLAALGRFGKVRVPGGAYAQYLWIFFLTFAVAELLSPSVAVWILAVVSFVALREYFTLVDIRLQDRLGVLGAFVAIPFMTYFVQIEWYGMFIISIPVYAFLVVPFLISLGGSQAEGTVFSVGAIVFGLFLLVYCVGHIAYLALHSTWRAAFLILAVSLCDLVSARIPTAGGHPFLRRAARVVAAAPLTVGLGLLLAGWAELPIFHAVVLGTMIPVLVAIGNYTMSYIETDLGIGTKRLLPGKGQVLDCLESFLYSAPVVFHYTRYYLT
jgi:phosphatidate cytidylyltransferase